MADDSAVPVLRGRCILCTADVWCATKGRMIVRIPLARGSRPQTLAASACFWRRRERVQARTHLRWSDEFVNMEWEILL
jgi:hypothetical protein